MLKVLLLVISVFTSSSTLAQWSKIEESSEAYVYIDRTSIRKEGNLRKVWELQDLKERDKVGGELSRRLIIEYDSKQERSRILSITSHKEQMARGKVIDKLDEPGKWEDIAPSSISGSFLKLVCAK